MRQPLRTHILLVPLAFALAATLTGCVSTSAYSDLDREAEKSDALPATLPDYATENMEPESIRLVGEDSGVKFYLGRTMDGTTCVLIYPGALDWVAGCGGGGLTVDGASVTARVVPDWAELEAGWSMVGANVQVKGLPE